MLYPAISEFELSYSLSFFVLFVAISFYELPLSRQVFCL